MIPSRTLPLATALRRGHQRRWLGLLLVCGLADGWLATTPARACGNEVHMTKATPKLLATAQEALEQGRNRRAMWLLEHVTSTDANLEKRRDLIAAVAEMRLLHSWNTDDPKYHQAPLKVLRSLLAKDPDNPYLRARVAEALSMKPGSEKEALQALTELEQRDLIPDGEAWATLARLRSAANDQAGAEQALSRCHAMAKLAQICVVASAASNAGTRAQRP